MPPTKPQHQERRTHAALDTGTAVGCSGPPDSLEQLTQWRAEVAARRSFGPARSAIKKKR
jgi:hypothetical protein